MMKARKSFRGLVLVFALHASAGTAQELVLKRDVPLPPQTACDAIGLTLGPVESAAPARAAEAVRLVSEATEASILGDYERSRTLIARAIYYDPASPAVRYRFGRLLETGDEPRPALEQFCRFLALSPDSDEADDVLARTEALGASLGLFESRAAAAAFHDGVDAFDGGDLDRALRSFSLALVERPDWDVAHYNRAVVHVESGRQIAAAADLEWYLEISPGVGDRAIVESYLNGMGFRPGPPPVRSPVAAFTRGVLIPGLGQYYAGRPVLGTLVLGSVATSIAVGALYEKTEIVCATRSVDEKCPDEVVLRRTVTRPLLVPGIAVAGAVTIIGAIHAYLSVAEPAPSSAGSDGFETDSEASAFRVRPALGTDAVGVFAALQIRF